MPTKHALIAMSGGVDSSVAAWLMQQAGYDCTGATMKLFANETAALPQGHPCCALDDVEDARQVAQTLGIPHYVFNFSDCFRRQVMDRFAAAYWQGKTPNPCIDCNRFLKFDKFLRRAQELEMDSIATGHYAQVSYDEGSGRWLLRKAADAAKDQSYVLYALTQEQLAHTRFPLGTLSKAQVREIAAAQGFLNAGKHDSQDICFVPNGKYADFIEFHTGRRCPPGDFLAPDGTVLGRHRGVIHYTVGQRRGLGLSLPAPLYVCALDPAANTVTLAPESALYSRRVTAHDINLIALPRLERPLRVRAKVRYRQPEQWATAVQTGEDTLELTFDEPQRAVTPGQAVVLYDGDVVIGGGTIG